MPEWKRFWRGLGAAVLILSGALLMGWIGGLTPDQILGVGIGIVFYHIALGIMEDA